MSSVVSVAYKDNLIECFGGMAQYEMIILEFSCRLKDDKRLHHLYGDFDIASLVLFQRETLDWAFTLHNSVADRNKAEDRVMLHHYRLLENGLSNEHYKLVCFHFVEALRDSWVDETVIALAVKHLKCLQIIFGDLGSEFRDCLDIDNEMDQLLLSSSFSEESISMTSSRGSPKPKSQNACHGEIEKRFLFSKKSLAAFFHHTTARKTTSCGFQ